MLKFCQAARTYVLVLEALTVVQEECTLNETKA